ncbi:MAG: amidase [Chloroflexota bacterium]
MSATDDLCFLSIAEAAGRLAKGSLSAVELTKAYLDRIAAVDTRVHAFVTLTVVRALADAERADRERRSGQGRGPLHGIPIALKDLLDTAGIRTTGHSRVFHHRVPDVDAHAVGLLREAGTVLLGKLAMHELATGAPDPEGPFPPARNPWDLERMPSGSSSGSGAALAAGLCAGALGSDTGGSIRGPAAWCGIVGHKPTYGLVSRRGALALSWSLDHVGPMARTVEDCAILLQAIAGHDPADPASVCVEIPDFRAALTGSVEGLRVGVPWSFLERCAPDLDPEVYAVFRTAVGDLERLGARVEPVEIPLVEHAEATSRGIIVSEAYALHLERFRSNIDQFGRAFLRRVLPGAMMTASDYLDAQRARAKFCAGMRGLMERVDLIALPGQPRAAESFADAARYGTRVSFTRFANATGQPSISVPCGFTPGGLPVGLMLNGRPFEDGLVLNAAHTYERAHDWWARRPTLEE